MVELEFADRETDKTGRRGDDPFFRELRDQLVSLPLRVDDKKQPFTGEAGFSCRCCDAFDFNCRSFEGGHHAEVPFQQDRQHSPLHRRVPLAWIERGGSSGNPRSPLPISYSFLKSTLKHANYTENAITGRAGTARYRSRT